MQRVQEVSPDANEIEQARILAWHFLAENRRLGFGDGRLVEVGQTLTVDCEPVLCGSGLHASVRAIDALKYAVGPVVCRVKLAGTIVTGDDKACATSRTVTAMADATNVLHEFACLCAERALTRERETGREPDARSWAAIDAKRKWLRNEITGQELAAAWAAASAATWAAASDAASDAAGAAVGAAARVWAAARAWAAAWDAARARAWAAAWEAARAAAGAVAWDAARAAAGAVAWDAAWAAAWEAAWDAARAAERAWQNETLERLCRELLGVSE